MSDESKTSTSSPTSGSWKLPDGIEEHIEAGLVKSAIGALAGGAIGMILFRSGKGTRAASLSAGLGVAVGSTYERYMENYQSNQ